MTASDAETAGPRAPAPIGGFFETHEPDGCSAGRSLLDAWTDGRPYAAFVNARSAFAALVAASPQATVWLPAYVCADLVQPADAARTRFYPVRDGFEADLEVVVTQAEAGDVVLVVAYFGLPVSESVRRMLRRRPDLRVVEDRAQALDAGAAPGVDWQLYSPRKLLGVADGGLIVATTDAVLPTPGTPAKAEPLWLAPTARRADPSGLRNAEWHAANQAKEAAMAATSDAMTGRSLAILSATSLESLSTPRLRNWRALDDRLRPWSALPREPASPPLGYVLRLPPDLRDRVLRHLHAQRIFAAVHWPRLAAPGGAFPHETQLARELITLPCDHRYGLAQMAAIADCVTAVLA